MCTLRQSQQVPKCLVVTKCQFEHSLMSTPVTSKSAIWKLSILWILSACLRAGSTPRDGPSPSSAPALYEHHWCMQGIAKLDIGQPPGILSNEFYSRQYDIQEMQLVNARESHNVQKGAVGEYCMQHNYQIKRKAQPFVPYCSFGVGCWADYRACMACGGNALNLRLSTKKRARQLISRCSMNCYKSGRPIRDIKCKKLPFYNNV